MEMLHGERVPVCAAMQQWLLHRHPFNVSGVGLGIEAVHEATLLLTVIVYEFLASSH